MNSDPRTKTLVSCADCGRGHWLPDPRLIQEGGEIFCNEECWEQCRQWRKLERARGSDNFPAAEAEYQRYQDELHARFMAERAARSARLDAELAELNAIWEAQQEGKSK